jgi:RNA polymerase sigma factor (sigma-70 family)
MAAPPDRPKSLSPDPDMGVWMAEFGPGLKRYFQKRAGGADADDLVQEVFLRLHQRAAEGSVENVQRYLFTVANRVLIDRHRHEAARRGRQHGELTEAALPVEEASPERILIGKQEFQRMVGALHKLPPRARQAFIFHRFEEMSYPAIARRMGISVVAVRKLIGRAVERIADVMEGRSA